MQQFLRIILLIAPLLAGAIAIFFTFQLMKRYRIAFVTSYFYYLVFLYIFGAYSLIGTGMLERLLVRSEGGEAMAHSVRLFMVVPGIPLLVLSKFMFIRSGLEIAGKGIHRAAAAVYFIIVTLGFILYVVFAVRLIQFNTGRFDLMVGIQHWAFAGFMIFIYTLTFILALSYSAGQHQHTGVFLKVFFSWYMLYMLLSMTAFLLRHLHETIPFIFVFVFLSWHLVPILYLNEYLEKYHGRESSVQKDFDVLLERFCRRFEISKREKEVISLLSRGMTNQEISEALYISLQTVKDHVHRIFVKTGVKNRIQLTNMIRSVR